MKRNSSFKTACSISKIKKKFIFFSDGSDSPHNQSPSPFSKERRMRSKYENDDLSREKVARIYQEELAKLMSCPPRDAFPK